VLAGLVAACNIGGSDPPSRAAQDSAGLVASALNAIATAPGVHYSLSIAVAGNGGIDSEGDIDFEGARFSGTADGGAPGAPMLPFGGPTHGALILADGLFVKTEGGPWERQPDETAFFHPLIDRTGLSKAFATAFGASQIDPAVRVAPCGAETCQVVGLAPTRAALAGLWTFVFADRASELPPDLAPMTLDLYTDQSGFPVRMETRITAGPTVTTVTLQLARLAPPPMIAPPIP
jgi:hypothetical protein